MIPRIGERIDPNQHYRLRPGAYVILPLGDQVLLTRESLGEPEIQLPGGGIDPGESPLQALYREVIEEAGWTISKPRRLGAFRRFVHMPDYGFWAEKLCHVYVAHPCRPISDPTEKFHETVWMPFRDGIRALGNDGDRMFLTRYWQTHYGR